MIYEWLKCISKIMTKKNPAILMNGLIKQIINQAKIVLFQFLL